MSFRLWSLKPSELRPLSRDGLLLLAARCALRVAPWRAPGLARDWRTSVSQVVAAVGKPPLRASKSRTTLARRIGDIGSTSCNRLDGTDEEAIGRCHSYASTTLELALNATALEGIPLRDTLLDLAGHANSIPAILAHDGRIRAPRGKTAAVEAACVLAWDATRRDVAALAGGAGKQILRAPLWPGRAPAWTRGP